MPASDQSALAIITNFSSAYIQKRYRKDGITEAHLYKLCRAVSVGFHAEFGQYIDDLALQRFVQTAEQGFLDNHAEFWGVLRRPGEGDPSLRLRVGQVKLRKWGAFNVDEMLELLAALLDTTLDNITWTECEDEAGGFEPDFIKFRINPDVFEGVDDLADTVDGLEADMQKVAPVGVRVIVTTSGTAQWDDGVTRWNDGFTWS